MRSRPCCSSSASNTATPGPIGRRPTARSNASGALDEDVIEGATFDNLDHFANELFEYLIYYNNHRPHQALAGQTPKAFAATKATAIQSAN
ncbi:IS3 family transposase [Bradyrhizobium sp. AZCC 1678]|uniref:IS3 family transposase n=1 Tax=Bradyrhizobium sp. AZCC 1678 TaxID=3117030 RepID=UPI003FA613BE